MKRLILAAFAAGLLATPVGATPYREFADFKRRATVGETIIHAFPNASKPSFRLILEKRSFQCIVWLEFVPRGGPFDGPLTPKIDNRTELVEAPVPGDIFDEHNRLGIQSFLEGDELHWVARGTNDALELLRVVVHFEGDEEHDGACVAGADTRFTPDLAYRDVVDSTRLTTYGEARLRGFPGDDPTFTLFVEYLEEGTIVEFEGGNSLVLSADACVLSLDLSAGAGFWGFIPFHDNIVDRRAYLIHSGGQEGLTSLDTSSIGEPLPWIAQDTGEAFVIMNASVSLGTNPEPACTAEARTQYAPRIVDFFR
jgi:hypothetical protein